VVSGTGTVRTANLLVEEPDAVMSARTGLWEPWVIAHPGLPQTRSPEGILLRRGGVKSRTRPPYLAWQAKALKLVQPTQIRFPRN
jgi:hypothetical protein